MGFLGDLFKVMFVNNPSYSGEFMVSKDLSIDEMANAIRWVHGKSRKSGELSKETFADDNSSLVLEYRMSMPGNEVDWYCWNAHRVGNEWKVILKTRVAYENGRLAKGNAQVMFNSAKDYYFKGLKKNYK